MTDLRAAAQQALEALDAYSWEQVDAARTALRAALAEPVLNPAPGYCKHCKQYTIEEPLPAEPVQEPVWVCPDSAEHRYGKPGHCEDCGKTLVQVAEPVQAPHMYPLQSDRMRIDPVTGDVGIGTPSTEPVPDSKHATIAEWWADKQRKPLTEEEISSLWDGHVVPVFGKNGINPIVFTRAIERAHGIT